MIFLRLKYYFSKFKICIYICGVILVLFMFVTLLRQVNLFTRADSQTLLGIIGTLLGAVVGAVFSLLGSIWVNTQQRKEELNRKRAQEIYGESMYFMEEDVPDEAVIEKVNTRFYEMADESIILKDMKDVYNGWMREEEMAIKILELLIRMAEK